MALSITIITMLEANAEERAAYLDYIYNIVHYFLHNCEVFGEIFVLYNMHSSVHLQGRQ